MPDTCGEQKHTFHLPALPRSEKTTQHSYTPGMVSQGEVLHVEPNLFLSSVSGRKTQRGQRSPTFCLSVWMFSLLGIQRNTGNSLVNKIVKSLPFGT